MTTRFSHVISLAGVALAAFLTVPAAGQSSDAVADAVAAWKNSLHADATAEAFTHWNDEGEIPENCALCHSGEGFRAFYGVDGSDPGVIGHPVPVGGLVDCETCHNDQVAALRQVRFPSGAEIGDVGSSAPCMTCHQGRQSTDGVNRIIAGKGDDTVDPALRFVNPHYAAAAATLFGTDVRGGYEYAGQSYSGRFVHVPDFAQCTDCHNPHALEVRNDSCVGCHQTEAVRAIRMAQADFDGDGDTSESLAAELDGMRAVLGRAIETYAREVAGTAIAYSSDHYPYFFNDTNANGVADADEAVYPNQYGAWTPRLVKAAYNFQFVAKDGGAFAHNADYAGQLLHDSIADLAAVTDIAVPDMTRP